MKPRSMPASRDHLPVPLRKSDEDATVTSHVQLPQISHVDTSSFVGLFDRFSNFDGKERPSSDGTSSTFVNVSTAAQDFAWPDLAAKPSLAVRQPQGAPMASSRNAIPARNDSTGSSSVNSSGQSSVTPTITRNSSCSSMDDTSPTPPPKDDAPEAGPTALPRVKDDVPVSESPVSLARPSRSNTVDSANSNSSQNLDLDKPLPIRPRRAGDVSKAVNFSRPKPPSAPQAGKEIHTTSRAHHRSASLNVLLPSGSVTSTLTAANFRGARLAKAVAHPTPATRARSQSASIAELEGSMQHTVRPLAPRKKKTPFVSRDHQISARTAEGVIYRIMTQLTSAQDLQSAALVSKGFYNTFHRNESKLVSHMMFQTSRATWETRRSIIVLKSSKEFRLCDYQKDLRTLDALKGLILRHADSICRSRTVAGLQGRDEQAARAVDEGLWRIWTFCALFGDNAASKEVPPAEIDWLNGSNGAKSRATGAGFGVGNGTGLTSAQLEDMNELWQCLQMLMSAFHGRYEEALRSGVLDDWNPSDGSSEAAHVHEWTSYLLTLGPQVILALSSASYERARILGLTRWVHPPPGQTRTTFLTGAISQVYQERLLEEATNKAAAVALPRQASARHRQSHSVDSTFSSNSSSAAGPSLRLDTSTPTIRRRPLSVSAHRSASLDIRPDCDPSHFAVSQRASTAFPASPTTDPSFYHTLTMNRAASTRLGPNLFPVAYATTIPRVPIPSATMHTPPPVSIVIDPVDRALNYLVHDMGFAEQNAKRALAMTDTGSGIDLERAVQLLSIESKSRAVLAPVELPTPVDIVSPLPKSKKRGGTLRGERCDGACSPPLVTASALTPTASNLQKRASVMSKATGHARSKSLGNVTDSSDTPVSPITDIYGGHSDTEESVGRDDMSLEWRREEGGGDTISPLVTMNMSPKAPLGRAQSGRSSKAWRVLGVDASGQPQDRKASGLGIGRSSNRSNVVGMEEYLARVERKRSMRSMAEQWKAQGEGKGEVFGVPKSAGEGASGKPSAFALSGGLGGLRPIVVERETKEGEGKSWRRSMLAGGIRREKTMREKVRCFPGGERLFME